MLDKVNIKGNLLLDIARLGAITVLVWALDTHPYSYYTLLRWVVCAVAAFAAYIAHSELKTGWVWVLGILAILFNPIIPVYLDRQTWAVIDILGATILLASLVFVRRARFNIESGETHKEARRHSD